MHALSKLGQVWGRFSSSTRPQPESPRHVPSSPPTPSILRGIAHIFLSLMIWGTGLAFSAAPEEDVETLDLIEITSTAVKQERRTISFPVPVWPKTPVLSDNLLSVSPTNTIYSLERSIAVAASPPMLDHSTEAKRVSEPVKPLRAERPPFPRQAREQGWEGVVLLHLTVNDRGAVEAATVKKSSGYPLLDSTAVQTVKQWTFAPKKNGNFPVSSIVDLPIKFDLRQ